MARYFFHSDNGKAYHDDDGLELPSDHDAELEAVRLIGALLAEQPEAFWSSQLLTVTVTDCRGRAACSLRTSVLRA